MNRVEAAIREGRCVLAIGQKALTNPEVIGELRKRAVPSVHLGGNAIHPVQALSLENLSPALEKPDGILVLIEPDAASDGRALSQLGDIIKASGRTPKVLVAASAYNPFMMPMNMRLLKMEGLKYRARDFVAALPVTEASPKASTSDVQKPKKKSKNELPFKAPKALFVGREDDVSQLKDWLQSDGGAIIVAGPAGIGKRWLIEHALVDSETKRWPDLTFGPGVGADTLIARIADATKAAGIMELHQAVTKKKDRPKPAELADLVAKTLANDALKGHVFVIHGIDSLCDRRRGHLRGDGRLEMILTAIFESTPAVRIVVSASKTVQMYNDGANNHLRTIDLGGLKGSVLHEMFTAHHVEETPRDKFGPIVERTLGHPMAARFLAISALEDGDIDRILEQDRFLKMVALDRYDALTRHIKRRIDTLTDTDRKALASCVLFRDPATTDDLRIIGIDRRTRLFLVSQGLLEQTPVDGDRRYYVHESVSRHLDYREVYDFDSMQTVGRYFHERHRELTKKEDGSTAGLAYLQEGNRLLIESRRERSAIAPQYTDMDAVLENLRSMIRRKKARLDIARQRVNTLIKHHTTHPELLLLNAELHAAEKSDFEKVIGAYNELHTQAPTPDGYFSEADLHARTRARGKTARALEHGLKAFPENARMYRRMASVALDQNKVDEAIVMLKSAMTLEPLMPDTYGLLADAYLAQGLPGWDDALSALNEALSIDNENARHWVRKASLLRDQAMASKEDASSLLTQADEAIKAALDLDKNHASAQELAACIILDRGGDADQAEWFLNQSKKRRDTSFGLVQRARTLIRKGTFDDVERLITKALKIEPSNHAAFAAQAEMWEGQGQIFHAFEAIKGAKERSHKDSAARIAYAIHMERLGALIESGAAAEMMKSAGLDQPVDTAPITTDSGERRDPGTTTIRRPKKTEEDSKDLLTETDSEDQPVASAETKESGEE